MKDEIVKIVIVDDHVLFADGLKRILEDIKTFKVIKTCCDWTELKSYLNEEVPDIIMLDIQLKEKSGLEICQDIKTFFPSIKIILISMLDNYLTIDSGKKMGANGFIPKTTDSNLVKNTVKNVLDGIDSFVYQENESNVTEKKSDFLITKREIEIIKLIKIGCNTSIIAEKLSISKYTVDTHRKNILKKLQLNSSNELIGFAYENYI